MFAALPVKSLSSTEGVTDMSKEQRRGNREAKKPKKDKSASTPLTASDTPWATVEKLKSRDPGKKK